MQVMLIKMIVIMFEVYILNQWEGEINEESEKQRLYYVDIIKNYEQINEELKNINASLLFENEKL